MNHAHRWKFIFFLMLGTASESLWSGEFRQTNGKNWTTYMGVVRDRRADPLVFNPSTTLPQDPEIYKWKIVGVEKDGQFSDVPAYKFNTLDNDLERDGSMSHGTPIRIVRIRSRRSMHFYGVIPEGTEVGPANRVRWIGGLYVKPELK